MKQWIVIWKAGRSPLRGAREVGKRRHGHRVQGTRYQATPAGCAQISTRPAVAESPAIERFRREAYAASALNHPNICTIYDIDEYQGEPFIAMELLSGRTVKGHIGDEPLPLERILDVAIQISRGLEAAHAQGIIHRGRAEKAWLKRRSLGTAGKTACRKFAPLSRAIVDCPCRALSSFARGRSRRSSHALDERERSRPAACGYTWSRGVRSYEPETRDGARLGKARNRRK